MQSTLVDEFYGIPTPWVLSCVFVDISLYSCEQFCCHDTPRT